MTYSNFGILYTGILNPWLSVTVDFVRLCEPFSHCGHPLYLDPCEWEKGVICAGWMGGNCLQCGDYWAFPGLVTWVCHCDPRFTPTRLRRKIFVRGTCVLNNVNFDKGYLKEAEFNCRSCSWSYSQYGALLFPGVTSQGKLGHAEREVKARDGIFFKVWGACSSVPPTCTSVIDSVARSPSPR